MTDGGLGMVDGGGAPAHVCGRTCASSSLRRALRRGANRFEIMIIAADAAAAAVAVEILSAVVEHMAFCAWRASINFESNASSAHARPSTIGNYVRSPQSAVAVALRCGRCGELMGSRGVCEFRMCVATLSRACAIDRVPLDYRCASAIIGNS